MTTRNIVLGSVFATFATVVLLSSAAQASEPPANENFVGPTITFGNGQSIVGIGGKFKVADQISLRPSYNFANLSGTGVTVVGGSATYEFEIPGSGIQPFAGAGVNFYNVNTTSQNTSSSAGFVQAGVDIRAGESLAVTGDVKVPLGSSAPLGTVVSFGGGYRF